MYRGKDNAGWCEERPLLGGASAEAVDIARFLVRRGSSGDDWSCRDMFRLLGDSACDPELGASSSSRTWCSCQKSSSGWVSSGSLIIVLDSSAKTHALCH